MKENKHSERTPVLDRGLHRDHALRNLDTGCLESLASQPGTKVWGEPAPQPAFPIFPLLCWSPAHFNLRTNIELR